MTRRKNVFIYTIIIGILTHAFRITNTMICSDSTNYLNSIGASWVTSLGRFLLPIVERIRGGNELPWLIGIISLFAIAASAVLFTEIFDIRSKVGQIFVAFIMVANPVVTSIFAYMYTADGYFFSLFFALLAAYLCLEKKGTGTILLSGICLACSLGFYQAFLSVIILVMLFYLFRMVYLCKFSWKEIGKKTGRCLTSGIVGLAVYGILLKIVWSSGEYGVTSYMGMDEAASSFGIQTILSAMVECYIDFARYYLVRFQVNRYNVMNVMMFGLTGILWIAVLTKKKCWKKVGNVVVSLLLFPMLPFVCHIFEFVSEGVSYTSTSMEYSLALVYLLPVIMLEDYYDNGELNITKKNRNKFWLRNIAFLLLCCISLHFMVIANRAYYNMKNANTKVEMLVNRIETRMEMMEGYHDDMQVAIYGSCYQIPEYVPAAPMMSGVVSNIFLTQGGEYINVMNHYLSTHYSWAGDARMKELAAYEEFTEMGLWPAENSLRIIDGTMVIILSENDMERYTNQ